MDLSCSTASGEEGGRRGETDRSRDAAGHRHVDPQSRCAVQCSSAAQPVCIRVSSWLMSRCMVGSQRQHQEHGGRALLDVSAQSCNQQVPCRRVRPLCAALHTNLQCAHPRGHAHALRQAPAWHAWLGSLACPALGPPSASCSSHSGAGRRPHRTGAYKLGGLIPTLPPAAHQSPACFARAP